MIELSKISTVHLRRNAYVYVRQSTPAQVVEHTESLERQYELAERAHALGWAAHQVVVIDSDLGRSGTSTAARDGFKQLVADVGLGSAGIILGIEVSRLARNNADWYQLLDLCAITDTLIADQDGVYHPSDFNDRLVLGLKGTMSEAELHLIRGRLTAGLRHKAAKGELRQGLPVGFDYDDDSNVIMCPDEAVIEAIATVFRRFDELLSARQVMLSLQEDGLLIPRRRNVSAPVTWARPSYPAIHDFLTNPSYAGAFVFGRNRTEKRVGENGRIMARTVELPRDEWEVLIPEHHPGFVTWERYVAIQDQLRANWRPPRGHGGGPAREGTALLQGRIRCGHCGRMMQTGYSGSKGNCPRYVCNNAKQLYGSTRTCQTLGGRLLEQRVLDELFEVLQPAALAATVEAFKEAEAHHAQRIKAFALAVERARFEADRAHRQFEQVEPENRLVARTLERAWEEKLAAVRRTESDLAAQQAHRPTALTEEEISWVEHAGADVRAIFDAPTTTWRERKQLVRALITEIVVAVNDQDGAADVTIVWEGGATTPFSMALRKIGGHFRATDEDAVDLVRRLAVHYDDRTIAAILSRQKRKTGTGLSFTKSRVASLRNSYGIPAFERPVTTSEGDEPIMTAEQVGNEFGVDKCTVYRWLKDGFIFGEQITPGAPWQIRVDDELRAKIAEDAPEGWLQLADAARVLGVVRQTVLHRVQRGELKAVYVRRGRRKGLRIQVKRDQAGLFA